MPELENEEKRGLAAVVVVDDLDLRDGTLVGGGSGGAVLSGGGGAAPVAEELAPFGGDATPLAVGGSTPIACELNDDAGVGGAPRDPSHPDAEMGADIGDEIEEGMLEAMSEWEALDLLGKESEGGVDDGIREPLMECEESLDALAKEPGAREDKIVEKIVEVKSWESDENISGRSYAESALRGLAPSQIAIRLRYGFEHLKTSLTSNDVFSIRRRGVEGVFRSFSESLQPKRELSERLVDELKGDGDHLSDDLGGLLSELAGGSGAETMEPTSGLLSTLAPQPKATAGNPVMDFYKIVMNAPDRIKGQPRDSGISWRRGEAVVSKQDFVLRSGQECFIYSDPSGEIANLELMESHETLLDRAQLWTADLRKFYWNASFKIEDQELETVRTLLDANAIDREGGRRFNVNNKEEYMITSLKQLEQLGIAVMKSSGGDVSSCVISQLT